VSGIRQDGVDSWTDSRRLPLARAIDPHLSPDATRVAYVRDDDLYVLPLDGGAETRLTRGGSALRPNGLSEFLAQEEFGRQRGFWWSPDSTRILYQQSDLSELPEWTMVGAPVADLRDYDAIMEVFFGPLGGADWDQASLPKRALEPPTPERPPRPVLLIHGTADDNVHIAHSLRFAAAMGAAGRPLELLPLLGQTHGVSAPDAAAAALLRTAAHFRKHLSDPPCQP
jgi:fermentation-respiration switch protein FrsA (DUF1100 family)